MARKHYCNFRYLTNMLKIRHVDLADLHNTGMLIKFNKQIANSCVKITNR